MEPLAGGYSGETFVSEQVGERVVVRIYGGRSRTRGPRAAEIDAAVLEWVRGLLPVPRVLESRPGDPADDVPPLLVTSFEPGVLLSELLPGLDQASLRTVGENLGAMLGRLALVATPRAGLFLDPDLTISPMPPEYADLSRLVDDAADDLAWEQRDLERLVEVALVAQTTLDEVTRTCLVHSDINSKNLLVDPGSLVVTALLDWEFAHSGSPHTDLGNLLRFDRAPAFVAGVIEGRGRLVPDQRDDALDLARAADLFALVDLARRGRQAPGESPVADRAAERLLRISRTGDVHAI